MTTPSELSFYKKKVDPQAKLNEAKKIRSQLGSVVILKLDCKCFKKVDLNAASKLIREKNLLTLNRNILNKSEHVQAVAPKKVKHAAQVDPELLKMYL